MTELQKLADQSRTLKDEVDILRLVNYIMYCSVPVPVLFFCENGSED